jgi:hypothetical protein
MYGADQETGPVADRQERHGAEPLPCWRLTSCLGPWGPRLGHLHPRGAECSLRAHQGSDDEPYGEIRVIEDRPLMLAGRVKHERCL